MTVIYTTVVLRVALEKTITLFALQSHALILMDDYTQNALDTYPCLQMSKASRLLHKTTQAECAEYAFNTVIVNYLNLRSPKEPITSLAEEADNAKRIIRLNGGNAIRCIWIFVSFNSIPAHMKLMIQ